MATLAQNPAQPAKLSCGEIEDDGKGLDFLPPPQVIGPDENGIKKVIEYEIGPYGGKFKVVTTTRVRKLVDVRVTKRAVERRSWIKFGDAVNDGDGGYFTFIAPEPVRFERTRAPGSKPGESKAEVPLSQFPNGVLMLCRTCGTKGEHWTSRCPYKDLVPPVEGFIDDKPFASKAASPASGSGKAYVPPVMRGRWAAESSGVDMRQRNDENSVRVSNLSEDTWEPDLLELFQPFGAVSRVCVAVDQKTGMSKGFGFVNFVNRDDAQRAINRLNGYGYDHLILRVEWATPKGH